MSGQRVNQLFSILVGIEKYEILIDDKKSQQPIIISTVNTAKTTLPHQKSSEIVQAYHEVIFACQDSGKMTPAEAKCLLFQKFKSLIEANLKVKESQRVELNTKLTRWIEYWANSIKSIKNLYN